MRRALRSLSCAAICATALSAAAPLCAQERQAQARSGGQAGKDSNSRALFLARGAHEPQQVDLETAHQRALAMYAEGALFHAPLPPAAGSALPAPGPGSQTAEPGPKEHGPEAVPWSLLAGVLVSALLIAWFLLRVRPALMPPEEEQAPQEPEPFSFRPKRRVSAPEAPRPATPSAPLPRRSHGFTGGARMAPKRKQR